MKWTPQRRTQARKMALAGQTHPQIAEALGITIRALTYAAERHGLFDVPADRMTIAELSAALGVNRRTGLNMARTAGLEPTRYGNNRLVSREGAEELIASRPDPAAALDRIPHDHHTYVTLARLWQMSPEHVANVLQAAEVPYVYARVAGNRRFVRCYHLADVQHLRPQSNPTAPSGAISTAELAERLNTSVANIANLRNRGMPTMQTRARYRGYYYRLRDVAEWLAARADSRTRRKGERLLRELGLEEMPCAAD